jgi:anaerobic selenocysteine-containing dehydrogenase
VLKETVGDKWDALEAEGYVEEGGDEPSPNVFSTPSGKFEFAVTALDRAGVKIDDDKDYLPHYSPVEPEGDAASYPLTLVPTELMRLASGSVGNPPFCTKTLEESELKKDDLFVEINPQTAADYDLYEGACAELTTPRGKGRVLVNLSEGIMPGLIGIPKGLGRKAFDDYLAGKGVDVNSLMGVTEDPISGLCATWGIRAKLMRV